MKAGVIGKVDGGFSRITEHSETRVEQDVELTNCIELIRTISLPDGMEASWGRAAIQRLDEIKEQGIKDGSIEVYEAQEKITKVTEFLSVPGEFVIVANGGGTFAFDLIGRQTDTLIERSELDLVEFDEDHSDANIWMRGFYGVSGNANNGIVYGNNLKKDSDFADIFASTNMNQVGLEYIYQDTPLKVRMSESGYVEVYQPSSFEVEEYLQFVLDEILEYVN